MQADGLLSTLKHLRLYGISQALHELVEQGSPACRDALPLIETLLKPNARSVPSSTNSRRPASRTTAT